MGVPGAVKHRGRKFYIIDYLFFTLSQKIFYSFSGGELIFFILFGSELKFFIRSGR